MSPKPNIIFIITDQQRTDTVNALGAPWMVTPNLDRLVREGTAFTNCFVTSPVCVASRASLFTGMYPHTTGVFTNFEPWQPTWVKWLAEAGYHCVNIGKMHINPYDALGGFHQRFPVENKDRPLFLEEHERAYYDEWDKALHARGLTKPSRYTRAETDPDGFLQALGCFVWEIDDDMHPDAFVGNTARWWLEERRSEAPFFLQVGFPGPHPPYDPIGSALDRYQDAAIPVPEVSEEELAAQPDMHEALRQSMVRFNVDSVAWRERPSPDEILRLRRYYAANVTMIDDHVGRLLDVLERRGYLENTVVIFCSDHADALGDHGHIQKWTMYDCVTRVPLIVRTPGQAARGRVSEDLVQLMDVAPTILDMAGVPVPANWEAKSLQGLLAPGETDREGFREAVYAELARDHIQPDAEYLIMRRDNEWKIVVYPGEDAGELYDLQADPGETRNLWRDEAHRARRDALAMGVLEWHVLSSHRAGRRPTPKPQAPMQVEGKSA